MLPKTNGQIPSPPPGIDNPDSARGVVAGLSHAAHGRRRSRADHARHTRQCRIAGGAAPRAGTRSPLARAIPRFSLRRGAR